MDSLTHDARLCLSKGVEIRAQGNGECIVVARGGVIHAGPQALPALGAFVVPRSVSEALSLLEPSLVGSRAAIDLMGVIMELCRIGALEAAQGGTTFERASRTEGYGAIPIHVGMLNDRARTSAWLSAVRAVVRPGDVVLDIGSGSGILAIEAAKAGARRVYAIEATSAADAARRMIAQNGVADRVEVIRGWSTMVELPERANVLVAELLDDDPFRESLLEITRDAIERFLEPGARMVPSGVRHRVALVEMPSDALDDYTFTENNVRAWSEQHSLDFRPLLEIAGPGAMTAVRPSAATSWRRLSEAATFVDVDLAEPPAFVDVETTLTVTASGTLSALMTWFEARVGPGLGVSTEPGVADATCHWRNIVLCLAQPRAVVPGEQVRARYRYPRVPEIEIVATSSADSTVIATGTKRGISSI